MLGAWRWLTLEVPDLNCARAFYQEHLGLPVRRETATTCILGAGETAELRLTASGSRPRGGIHTHYALACPVDVYEDWVTHLEDTFDLHEEDFGSMKSLYFEDPAGHCVEVAAVGDPTGERTITGIFEVVLEVTDLERASSFYQDLGFEVTGWGEDRRRVRLTTGEADLELWEPQRGIADALGGVHVDTGLAVDDPEAMFDRVASQVHDYESTGDGVRFQDPDCHRTTLGEQ